MHMRYTWNASVCLGVVCLALLGVLILLPGLGGCQGLLDLANELGKIADMDREINVQRQALQECRAAKQRVLPAVIAGQLTLIQAAESFRKIDQRNPRFQMDAFQQGHPGRTDLERHCRAVIGDVRTHLLDRPDMAEAIVQRLESELLKQFPPEGSFPPQEK
jgi:hypothetical protein